MLWPSTQRQGTTEGGGRQMSQFDDTASYGETAEYREIPPPRRRRGLSDFFVALSGARPEILARCPTERNKFVSLGWAILITCTMATVSMWFALTSVLGINPVGAFPVALIWGLVIMGIDRWLVISMPAEGRRKLVVALPRLLLALLLGSLISTPIVLRIFQSEINNQVSIIKENNAATFDASQQKSSVQATVTKWQNSVNNLQLVIDSGGQQAINPATDPTVVGLTSQLKAEQATAATDYKAWQCQLYGGCGAPKGSGPLAAASKTRYENDEAQITNLNTEIQTRETQLKNTNASSASTRLAQAKAALPNAQSQLTTAQNVETGLTNSFDTTNSATNGLLIRLKALDQLSAGDSTLQMARLLLFLLFLLIEMLPVTVKLLQQPGNYEKILKKVTKNELKRADWDLRDNSEHGFAADGDEDLRPTASDAGFGGRSGGRRTRSPRRPIDDDLRALFSHRVKSDPAPPRADYAKSASDYAPYPEDITGPNRVNNSVREMTDTRHEPNRGGRQGVERLYDAEDL